jgi:hypothetical protein
MANMVSEYPPVDSEPSPLLNAYFSTSIVILCFFLEFLTLEDGTDRRSQKVGKELLLHAAQKLRKAQVLL